MRARRFEDLVAWQRARELARAVYGATKNEPFCRDFGLAGQIQRAAVSVLSNIAEGVERTGTNELIHFLSMAKGSAAEVRAQLYVAFDIGYLTQPQFDALYALADETGRLLTGLRASLIDRKATNE